MTCDCAKCTSDKACRVILARFWSPDVWLSHVGTLEERNDWRERTPDGGPRGEIRSGGVQMVIDEIYGELPA